MSTYDLDASLSNLQVIIGQAKDEFEYIQERIEELETENEIIKRGNENLKLELAKAQDELKELKELKELLQALKPLLNN